MVVHGVGFVAIAAIAGTGAGRATTSRGREKRQRRRVTIRVTQGLDGGRILQDYRQLVVLLVCLEVYLVCTMAGLNGGFNSCGSYLVDTSCSLLCFGLVILPSTSFVLHVVVV